MQFVYPQFLWALWLLSIPIVIHLFNFRRYKKLLFSHTAFITAANTVNKKQQKIKKWLVLVCRILFIAFLVLAFAQPYIKYHKDTIAYADKIVSVYIDNSFSMANIGEEGELFETAKNNARKIAEMQNISTNFLLLTNDFEGKHQHLINKELFIKYVDEIKISSAQKQLSDVINRKHQLLNQYTTSKKVSYIISDFQKGFYNEQYCNFDSAFNYIFVPIGSNITNNIGIDTVFINTPFIQINKPVRITATIKNYGLQAAENIPVNLKVNGNQKAIQNATILPGNKEKVEFNITLNDTITNQIEIQLTDYPIVFDDHYYLCVKPEKNVNILLINNKENDEPIKKVYQVDDFYKLSVQEIQTINFNAFKNAGLIILHEPENISSGVSNELQKYVEQGGTLFVISGKSDNTVNDFLTAICGLKFGNNLQNNLSIAEINTKELLLNDVFTSIPKDADMPFFLNVKPLERVSNTLTTNILTLNNGSALLTKSVVKKGLVFAMGASLNEKSGNFHKHALFVPVMLKMPLLTSNNNNISYNLNNASKILINSDIKDPVVEIKNNNFGIVSNITNYNGKRYANTANSILNAGFYNIVSNDIVCEKIALNYPRNESVIGYNLPKTNQKNIKTIQENIEVFEAKTKNDENDKKLWFYALLIALAFLIAEILILRFFKN